MVKQKYIYKLNVFKDTNDNLSNTIPMIGSNRIVEIIGTPGAMFSLTINKKDGCSILGSPLDNVSIPEGEGIKKYTFIQNFPPSIYEETYEIMLTPCADVKLGGSIPITTPTYSMKQYINPLVTFTNKATIAVTIPTTYTIRGKANTYPSETVNLATSTAKTPDTYGDVSISWTIAKSDSGYLYTKKQPDSNDWSDDVSITKKVSVECEGSIIKMGSTTADLDEDMIFAGSVTTTKRVLSIEDTTDCDDTSNSIVLDNVTDLKVGMLIASEDLKRPTYITAIDDPCNKITISSREPIKYNSKLTFAKEFGGIVEEVIDDFSIKIKSPEDVVYTIPPKFPAGLVLTFNRQTATTISSSLRSTSGDTKVVISGDVSVNKFGEENITFTQDLDNILTYTPNAYDQTIVVSKGTATTINLLAPDTDENYRVKTPTIRTTSSNGAVVDEGLSAGVGTITYTPTSGYVGPDLITFIVNDGTTSSDTKSIYITVK